MKIAWNKRELLLLTLLLGVGAAAFLFLGESGPPARYNGRDAYAWARLVAWNPDQKSRAEAAAALQSMGTNALPLLRQRLAEKGPLLSRARVWLGARLPGKLGHALTKNLKPVSYSSIRSTAAMGLKELGTNAVSAVPNLIRAMHDPDLNVRWSAATALGETGGVGALALTPLMQDPDYIVRHAAAYALGQIGPPALTATPVLVQRLGDVNNSVRDSARYSLSRIGSVAGPIVLKMVQESHGEARRNAAKALVAVHPRGQLTLPVLVEMARDPDAASRAVAIESMALLRLSHTNAMEVYVVGLADTNSAVRVAAAKALEQTAHKSGYVSPTLAALKENDPDEAVRTAAADALEKIAEFQSSQAVSK